MKNISIDTCIVVYAHKESYYMFLWMISIGDQQIQFWWSLQLC